MRIRNFALALVSTVFILSCTKDDDDTTPPVPPTYPVEGLWVGTYTVDGQGPTTYPYAFSFQPNGVVVASGQGDNGTIYVSTGTYTVVDSVIKADYKTVNYDRGYQVSQKATLRYHSDGTITDGVWQDNVNPAGHLEGKFQNLKRIN
jgi:hypothetical protein